MTNYKKGVRFEREVMEIFKKEGFDVARTAGSHGPWDVVMLKRTAQNEFEARVLVLVQCKVRKRGKGGSKAKEEASEGA